MYLETPFALVETMMTCLRARTVSALLWSCAVGLGASTLLSCVDEADEGEAKTPASIKLPEGGNLIKNVSFEGKSFLPWTTSFSQPGEGDAFIEDGWFCMKIRNPGINKWDAQMRHREMTIRKTHKYSLKLRIKADKATRAQIKIGTQSGWPEYFVKNVDLDEKAQTVGEEFSPGQAMKDQTEDTLAELAIHFGGGMARGVSMPLKVCIDDVYLIDPEFKPEKEAQTAALPPIRINQVGYFPYTEKFATLVSKATAPVDWEVLDAQGKTSGKGTTTPFPGGTDEASGDMVQWIDFSGVRATGTGMKVKVGSETSPPFDIARDLYKKLKIDALRYFYHNRAGIDLKMPFVGDKKWERGAGIKDDAVACAPEAKCNYSLDVSGGWYDAGDHGKYVVNGGIAVWTLMNLWERMKYLGTTKDDFGDGKLNIPEGGNRVPDVLDEARWEMEFLLKMQVPEGKPMAGMVHHKIHDEEWTALATPPDKDTRKRFLRPVSTAATLNLAATGAQASRVFREYDKAFADKCLAAAEKAWTAAKANPDKLALPTDNHGGGPYDDNDVSDEQYWAAAELYVTTKKPEYLEEVKKSPHFEKATSKAAQADVTGKDASSFDWGNTGPLGTISMAVVPGSAGADAMRKAIVKAADVYAKMVPTQGYRLPMQKKEYPWGSNSFLLNNMLLLGFAYDFSHDGRYLNAMVSGMDYLLGRNAMAQSFVTGYGTFPLLHPHHRFWSHQVDPKLPEAPPGCVSGGPNSGLQDPYVRAMGLVKIENGDAVGVLCKPQKCFVDHIEAWSANEITINWNAPLAWVAAYLDEQAGGLTKAPASGGATPPGAKKPPPKSASGRR
jgi:endoglucanase